MIISRSAIVLILACAAVSVSVVGTSQKTLALRRELAKVQHEIEQERGVIAVLESEWELFTAAPSLDKKLGKMATPLVPLSADAIIQGSSEIPIPPPDLLLDGPRVTQMVAVDGIDGLVPLPAQKPGFRVRQTMDTLLSDIAEAGRDGTGETAVIAETIIEPKPDAPAMPDLPLPDGHPDDAIGRLLLDLALARDALAEVPSQ